MRILEITGEPILHGGQEIYIHNVLCGLKDNDLQIDVLTPYNCDNGLFRQTVSKKNGKVYELKLDFKPYKSRKMIYRPVLDFLKKNEYDVIHIHSGSISVLAYEALAAKRAGIKKIIVHSHSTGEKGLRHFAIHTLFGPLLKFCPTHYLACSKEAGEMKFPRSVQKKVLVVKNGIDLKKFKRDPIVRKSLRDSFGISEDPFVIGHIGRFTSEKNHSFLIDVFSKISNENSNCCLLLIGEGELQQKAKEQVKELGLEDKVLFTGNVDNPQDYYNMMDFFVLPSLYEGFSFVTLEAQANGLPCLVSAGVPNAVLLSDSVAKLELNEKKWADYLLEHRNEGIKDNESVLREKGYDLSTTVDVIGKLYHK